MITKAYSSFFKDLAKNNNKEWFHANKKRYENDVKIPFLTLLETLVPMLNTWDDRILLDSKKALFRINRDIRFSKDKSPYNTIMKASFSPGGKKSELPGYYIGIDAEHVYVGGGLFMINTADLKKLRSNIAKNINGLLNIINDAQFIREFGQLKGEKSKRLDKSLRTTAEKTDLIYNKQFYAMAEFPIGPFYTSKKLESEIQHHFKVITPLNTYLNQVLEQPRI